ncbi:MAG: osmoprotectant transporter permease [Betaproteobacteria bacterium]
MIAYRILWGIDVLTALAALGFFLIGVADGSVSSFNITLWLGLLATLAAVLFGARALRARGHTVAASVLAGALAVPALLFALLLALAISSGTRWN